MASVGEITEVDITRRRGDTRNYVLTVKDKDGSPIDVTGYTCLLTVNTLKAPDLRSSPVTGSVVFQASGAPTTSPIPSPLDGKLTIDMGSFGGGSPPPQPGSYFYDIQITDANGRISTVLAGKFKVVQDITK